MSPAARRGRQSMPPRVCERLRMTLRHSSLKETRFAKTETAVLVQVTSAVRPSNTWKDGDPSIENRASLVLERDGSSAPTAVNAFSRWQWSVGNLIGGPRPAADLQFRGTRYF